jgi:hypothetical protein
MSGRNGSSTWISSPADGDDRQDRSAHHRILEVLRVVLGKRGNLLRKQDELLGGARFEAVETLTDVGEESGLRELAVGDDLDAAFDLLAHTVGDRLRQHRIELAFVVGLS